MVNITRDTGGREGRYDKISAGSTELFRKPAHFCVYLFIFLLRSNFPTTAFMGENSSWFFFTFLSERCV